MAIQRCIFTKRRLPPGHCPSSSSSTPQWGDMCFHPKFFKERVTRHLDASQKAFKNDPYTSFYGAQEVSLGFWNSPILQRIFSPAGHKLDPLFLNQLHTLDPNYVHLVRLYFCCRPNLCSHSPNCTYLYFLLVTLWQMWFLNSNSFVSTPMHIPFVYWMRFLSCEIYLHFILETPWKPTPDFSLIQQFLFG